MSFVESPGFSRGGRFKGRWILLIIILTPLIQVVAAAEDPSFFIGDPIAAFKKLPVSTQDKIKLVIGLVAACTIITGLISLFASHAKTSAGAAIGNAAMRNEGTHGMLMVVGLAIVLIIAIGVFWFFMTGGI